MHGRAWCRISALIQNSLSMIWYNGHYFKQITSVVVKANVKWVFNVNYLSPDLDQPPKTGCNSSHSFIKRWRVSSLLERQSFSEVTTSEIWWFLVEVGGRSPPHHVSIFPSHISITINRITSLGLTGSSLTELIEFSLNFPWPPL